MSHFGIRAVFSKEIIWLVFAMKKRFTQLLTEEKKFGLQEGAMWALTQQTNRKRLPL